MTHLMADERVRLVVVVEDELRAALRLEAAKRDMDMSEIISELLRDNLQESLAEVRKRKQAEEGKKGKR